MRKVIVIPAFNEERLVSDVVADARQVADAVIVVDDGSTDASGPRARAAGALVVRHPMNRGVGAATMTGVAAALKLEPDAVVTMDADGQHRGADAGRLFSRLGRGDVDLVLGSRLKPDGEAAAGHMPLRRRLYNRVGNWLTYLLFGLRVSDSQSGLKGFTRAVAQKLDLRTSGPEACSEIISLIPKHLWRYDEIAIPAIYTAYSMSKGQSFRLGVRTAWQLLQRAWRG